MVALFVTALCWSAQALSSDASELVRHNPFDRPALLEIPPAASHEAPVEEAIEPPPLTGTLVSVSAPMAIFDQVLLRVGEEHKGFRLVGVEEGAAVFERSGREYKVSIAEPDIGARQR